MSTKYRIHPIETDFPIIFKDLLEKFPQFEPRKLINAVIKYRFIKYYSWFNLPISQIFYVGVTALFEEWSENGKNETAFDDFFQKSFSKVSKEIYRFLKIECPELFGRTGFSYGIEKENGDGEDWRNNIEWFPHPGPDPYDINESREILELFFGSLTSKKKELFKHYLLGYSAEEIADIFMISKSHVLKIKRNAVKNLFRLSIKKARKNFGVDPNPICLNDHYKRTTLDEKREKNAERMRKWRKRKKIKSMAGC